MVPSRWSFARRHMLDTGELMWTSVKRVGTRGIRRPAGAVENVRRLGLIRPRDLVPSPSLGGPPAAGRQRVFVGASSLCRRMFSGLSVVACHCGGYRGPGPVRASVVLSQVLARSRGHTCRTLRGTGSVSNAILTIRKVPGWHVDVVPSAAEAAVRAVLAVKRLIWGRRAATTP